jgi:hypothetical protein
MADLVAVVAGLFAEMTLLLDLAYLDKAMLEVFPKMVLGVALAMRLKPLAAAVGLAE